MYRVLKKDSLLLIGVVYIPGLFCFVMNPFLKFSDEGDYHICSVKEMKNLLNNNFKIISSQKKEKHLILYVSTKK